MNPLHLRNRDSRKCFFADGIVAIGAIGSAIIGGPSCNRSRGAKPAD
jgi:hypothetical protein